MDEPPPDPAAIPARRRRLALFPLAPRDLAAFAREEALACVFPIGVFAALALTRAVPPPAWLPRYDLLFLLCLLMQAGMLAGRLETWDEVKVICVFHVLGLGLELFKTRVGSWAYPDFAYTKLTTVPLYSGFLYASVASYVCQAWRRFDLRLDGWPGHRPTTALVVAIYANFFTNHWLPDARWLLIPAVFLLFRRTTVRYRVSGRDFRMPLVLGFGLIGLFVWFAENYSTYFGAWVYPNQKHGWQAVHQNKITSWALLVILTVVIVAQLKRVKEKLYHTADDEAAAAAEEAPSVP